MAFTGLKIIKSVGHPNRNLNFRDLGVIGGEPHGDKHEQCSEKWFISAEPSGGYLIMNTGLPSGWYLGVDSDTQTKAIISTQQQPWNITQVGTAGHYRLALPDGGTACSLPPDKDGVTLVQGQSENEQWLLDDPKTPIPGITGTKYIKSVGHPKSGLKAYSGYVLSIEGSGEQWDIEQKDQFYTVKNKNNGQYLSRHSKDNDVGISHTAVEWAIEPVSTQSGTSFRFKIQDPGSGYMALEKDGPNMYVPIKKQPKARDGEWQLDEVEHLNATHPL